MPANWSTTTTQVNLEELLKIRRKLCDDYEKEFSKRLLENSIFKPMEFQWLKPQEPKDEQFNAMKFRVFTEMAVNFGVPKHILFAADFDVPKANPKNKWLRIAALVVAVIIFVAIWSQ